jgi:hypothetical protein
MGFSLAKIATIVSELCLYLWNSHHLPRVAPASFRLNCGQVLSCAPMIAAIFTKPGYVTIIMWILEWSINFAFNWWSWLPKDGKRIAIPIHIEHMVRA